LSLDPVFQPGDPLAMGGYAYGDDDPVNRDDPAGTTVNTYGACAYEDPSCGRGLDEAHFAPHGGLGDFFGGVVNSIYSPVRTLLTLGAYADGFSAARAVGSVLPSRIGIGNPGTTLFGAGGLAALLFPGLDEADGAALIGERAIAEGTERLAPEAAGNIVYRGLAQGEDPALGLSARAPGATDVSPLSHVAGKINSPWISTTKSLETATTKYGKFGVVGIDLNRVTGEVVDISGGFPDKPGMFSNWAIKDQEVLIRGFVPPAAIFFPPAVP
jgi:hypothetical protein